MSASWQAVAMVGFGAIVFKAAGPLVIGGRTLPPRVSGLVGALAPAILGALVATQVFAAERALTVDARALGLLVAAGLVGLRAPVLVVVLGAAVATGLARSV